MRYFKDDVNKRCVLLETIGDIFAADLTYHSNCLSNDILEFKREVEILMNDQDDLDETENVDEIFKDLMKNFDFHHHAIYISTIRDSINAKFETEITNRKVKNLLIRHFREEVCFMYPKDKAKSQLFFSNSLQTDDLVENLRTEDPVITCAKLLREEAEQYDFLLEDSYNASSDLLTSYEILRQRQPVMWKKFFDILFPNRKYFDDLQRKCDTIFQIIYGLITKKKTPLHIFIAQAVHDASRSKKVITILNRLGLSISYLEMMRIDARLAKRTILETGHFRVPVNKTI